MLITFYGGVREVTGSMHMITSNGNRILLDCGMFQGRRKESAQKNRIFPIDTSVITNLVLSHAHIDHSGRLPLLTKNGYTGRITSTAATADACEYLLMDSAHIQESDAQYLNYKTVRSCLAQSGSMGKKKKVSQKEKNRLSKLLKKGGHKLNKEAIENCIDQYNLDYVEPLYSSDDAQTAINCFESYPYQSPFTIGDKMSCTFYDAGHILGSAISIIKAEENGRKYTIAYTGDLGRFDKPIIHDPELKFAEEDREIDLLIMESTYGNRIHGPVDDLKVYLKEAILNTYNRNGTVLIPAFAFGRSQEIIYMLHELYNEKAVPRIPVYVDSPLAINLTRVFGEHPETYDRDTHKSFLEKGENPFSFPQINFTRSVDESIALMREEKPHIVIASSGMCEAGRILHHLRYKIHNEKNTILIVGFMARHTLGRRILEQGRAYEKSGRSDSPPLLKIMGKHYPLKAQVIKMNGFSAHGDKTELLRFLNKSNLKVKKIAVVHGEEDQSVSFAKDLNNEGFSAIAPHAGETISIG